MLRVVLVSGLAACVACGHGHGPPHVRGLPKPDGVPALRGGGPARSPRLANYKIDAALDADRHVVTGTETLTWTNGGASAVDSLPFHLYLNAFKNENSLFMRTSGGTVRGIPFPENAWGWIHIDSLKLAGVELVGKLKPQNAPDETVVELPLAHPVEPGASIELTFAFTEQLPEVIARTGYQADFHLIGQWFPKIGVRVGPPGAEHWECQPFHANSEFFADFGTYDVTLTTPATYTVAATGVLVNAVEAAGGKRTFTYRAEDVHDFVWMADPYMNVLTGQAKLEEGPPVEVRVYYHGEQKDFAYRHLEAAIGTLERMSAWFYPYPWPIMTIIDPPVEAADGAGGMEYPTLVTTGGDSVFTRAGVRIPEYETVHEVGHNWFQGLLASDEVNEAWLDEGVNSWADGKVMNDLYGARGSIIDWNGWQAEIFAAQRAWATDPGSLPSPIATASYAFADFDAYAEASYSSTLRAMRTLELTFGATKFAAAMKTYAHDWAWKHPTGRDLFDELSRGLGTDLTWFFGPVFHEVGGLRLSVRSHECSPVHDARGVFDYTALPSGSAAGSGQARPGDDGGARKVVTEVEKPDTGAWHCEVTVQNTGTIHVPVDVLLRFADGGEEHYLWDDRGQGSWKTFTPQHSSKLTDVILDPDNKLQLDQPLSHHVRIEGDGAASLRAASWFGGGVQTLMQMVGP
jgi:hypothetical protein